MLIAVACDGKIVAKHFGRCEKFCFFETEDKEIIKIIILPNPGNKPGYLPEYLIDLGADIIMVGSIGKNAAKIFYKNEKKVISDVTGDARDAVIKLLKEKNKKEVK